MNQQEDFSLIVNLTLALAVALVSYSVGVTLLLKLAGARGINAKDAASGSKELSRRNGLR
jgi:hypothetical protein